MNIKFNVLNLCVAGVFFSSVQAQAAIALDRTRVIFDGDGKSVSLNITNNNKELPYLAQGWLEDVRGNKISSPMVVVPPLQRVEPGSKSQIKIQATSGINTLPKDRESVFYFNLREIPPKSDKENTLQIALQTRIKLFFRPSTIKATQYDYANPWQNKIKLTSNQGFYRLDNPTPYFVTLVSIRKSEGSKPFEKFEPVMVEPYGHTVLNINASSLGNSPVISYINDFGGRPSLIFKCQNGQCVVKENKPG